jgi:hypothetical protein
MMMMMMVMVVVVGFEAAAIKVAWGHTSRELDESASA